MAKQDDYSRYTIRVPQKLYAALEDAAGQSGRSLNAEIIQRLEFAMSEDLWERRKFIDTLNLKQHVIDKQIHILFDHVSRQSGLKKEIEYERLLRRAIQTALSTLCAAVLNGDASSVSASEIARRAALLDQDIDSSNIEAAHNEIRRRVGDTDDVQPDWEDQLSEESKAWLAQARQFARDYE